MSIHAFKRRDGSVLLVVVWLLIASSMLVFAAQGEALENQRGAYARFQRAATLWTARGGVHHTVAYLMSFAPQPALALQVEPKPGFYEEFRDQKPLGWFVGSLPYRTGTANLGPTSEQARMPLSKLTTAAAAVLIPDSSMRQAFQDHVTARRVLSDGSGGGPRVEQAQVFRHALELLFIPGFTLAALMGQDWNDNGVLDPHEVDRAATGPNEVRLGSGLAVDRGIIDVVTAFSDGKFDPYEAPAHVRNLYLGDWPGKADVISLSDGRPPPAIFGPSEPEWTTFSTEALTNVTSYFRIQCFGTLKGEPMARVRCVVEYMEEKDVVGGWFRIVDWRQDA